MPAEPMQPVAATHQCRLSHHLLVRAYRLMPAQVDICMTCTFEHDLLRRLGEQEGDDEPRGSLHEDLHILPWGRKPPLA